MISELPINLRIYRKAFGHAVSESGYMIGTDIILGIDCAGSNFWNPITSEYKVEIGSMILPETQKDSARHPMNNTILLHDLICISSFPAVPLSWLEGTRLSVGRLRGYGAIGN